MATASLPRDWSSGESALRKAYDDRVQHIGQKLQSNIGGVQYGEGVNSHGALTRDAASTEREVDVLVQRIRELCQERRSFRHEAADHRHMRVVRDLRVELTEAQHYHGAMALEQERLRGMLAACNEEQQKDNDEFDRQRIECVRSLGLNEEKLAAGCEVVEGHLAAVQAEIADYRQRIELLSVERTMSHGDVAAACATQRAARMELDNLWHRVRQSEVERTELEEKCSLVSMRFERALDASTMENDKAVGALRIEVRNAKKKVEKQRRKCEEARAMFAEALRTGSRQQKTLQEHDAQIVRLQESCRSEREAAQRHEDQFMENQRRALDDHSQELQMLSDMMPLATHQKILDEQSEWFQASTRHLEEALRQRLKVQEETMALQLRKQSDALEQQLRLQEQQQRKIREQRKLLREHEHEDMLELEHKQEELASRCWRFESEIRDAREGLAQAESANAAAEERRRASSASLEASTRRLSELRLELADERTRKGRAQIDFAEARKRLEALVNALNDAESQLEPEPLLRYNHQRLEEALTNHKQQIFTLSEAVAQLKENWQTIAAQISTLRSRRGDADRRLQGAQRRIVEIDCQKAIETKEIHRKEELLLRMRCLLRGHIDLLRRGMADLKHKLKHEQKVFSDDFQTCAKQWQRACIQGSERLRSSCRPSQESIVVAGRHCEQLECRLEQLRKIASSYIKDAESTRKAAAKLSSTTERVSVKMQTVTMFAERVLRAIGASLPDGLSEGTVRILLAAVTNPCDGWDPFGCDGTKEARVECVDTRTNGTYSRVGGGSGGSGGGWVSIAEAGGFETDADGNGGSERHDVATDLETTLNRSVEAARIAAATAERTRWKARVGQARQEWEAKERASMIKFDAREAAISNRLRELENHRRDLDRQLARHNEDSDGSCTDSVASGLREEIDDTLVVDCSDVDCKELIGKAAALLRDIGCAEAAEAVASAAAAKAVAAKETYRNAQLRLQREVDESVAELHSLRRKFSSELGRREAEWQEHRARLERGRESETHRLRSGLHEQMLKVERELRDVNSFRQASMQERDGTIAKLQDELAAVVRTVDQTDAEACHLRDVCATRAKNSKRIEESLLRLERRCLAVAESSRRDDKEAKEDHVRLGELHAESMAQLRRQRDDEIARLEGAVQQSLSRFSVEISSDSDAALLAHSELRASAARLADRARAQLGDISQGSTASDVGCGGSGSVVGPRPSSTTVAKARSATIAAVSAGSQDFAQIASA
eukprot:TRINITY_DN10315_c0_g1_i1.p1 TRINITY_DN10315_c0_g1~~TRINITY_DN10315_c0_g1_i1.p1  ORF type:complete len:1246 (-),score=269.06 TRINITY_DN10315_c0_g1_i1:385-4122(-)